MLLRRVRPELVGAEALFGRHADTPMPVRDSEAIVLRSFPLGEADRLVSFLSRSAGRLRGVARGARRPKSRFGSTLEPLSHIRIWYYERETRELVRINQCELIESFLEAQRDYSSGTALALMAEVTEAVLPERETSDPMFRLLLVAAHAVRKTGRVAVPLAYFSLWTMRLGGWLPPLERCARCGEPLTGDGYASPEQARVFCARCRRPGLRKLSAAALAAARAMLAKRLEELPEDAPLAAAAPELTDFLLDAIEHQIERKLAARSVLEPRI